MDAVRGFRQGRAGLQVGLECFTQGVSIPKQGKASRVCVLWVRGTELTPNMHTQKTGVASLAHVCEGQGIRLQKGRVSLPGSAVSPIHWTSGRMNRGRARKAGEVMDLLTLAG